MSSTDDDPSGYTRRRFLTLSIASGASASLLLSRNSAEGDKPPPSKTDYVQCRHRSSRSRCNRPTGRNAGVVALPNEGVQITSQVLFKNLTPIQ
jgi:hypothetical protein